MEVEATMALVPVKTPTSIPRYSDQQRRWCSVLIGRQKRRWHGYALSHLTARLVFRSVDRNGDGHTSRHLTTRKYPPTMGGSLLSKSRRHFLSAINGSAAPSILWGEFALGV